MVPYNHLVDSSVFLRVDDQSTFYQNQAKTILATQAGQVVQVVTDNSGNSYDLSTSDTGITLGISNGKKYLIFDGNSRLNRASSTPFDNQFLNTGENGGWSVYLLLNQSSTNNQSFIFTKNAVGNNGSSVNYTVFNGVGNGKWQSPPGYRPYNTGNIASFGLTSSVGTEHRDGQTTYFNGAPSFTTTLGTVVTPDSSGYPLSIGGMAGSTYYSFAGNLYTMILFNRALKPHEMLSVDRYYRAQFGLPENLLNQPYAIVTDSNSETTVPQTVTEPGFVDRSVSQLGISLDASFMLGQGSRSQTYINADFNIVTKPLIEYLKYLGMKVVYFNFEAINDNYVASRVLDNYNLVSPLGVGYVTATCFQNRNTNPTNFNTTILGYGSTYNFPVVDWHTTMAPFSEGNFGDGLHINGSGISLMKPGLVVGLAAAGNNAPLPVAPVTDTRPIIIVNSYGGWSQVGTYSPGNEQLPYTRYTIDKYGNYLQVNHYPDIS